MSDPLTDERLAAIQARVEAIPYQATHPEARNMQSVYVTQAEIQLLANGFTDMRDLLAEVRGLREAIRAMLAVDHWENGDTLDEIHEIGRKALGEGDEP